MKVLVGISRCPFCGAEAYAREGLHGIHYFYCTNKECGACVSFLGEHKLPSGIGEAANPVKNWTQRAIHTVLQKEA